MKLYVVMPVINCLELTKAALASIKSNCSIILIDNASTDGTANWFQNESEYVGKYIYNSPAKGVAESWNQGVKMAFEDEECEYVAILNNDIVLHPKTLPHLMAFMDKSKYLMVTGDNIKDRASIDTLLRMELPKDYTDFDLQTITDWRAEGPDFSCFMINRETIEVIGWFDENFKGAYCEDQDYHVRFNRAWRWGLQYGVPEPERCHAKRLSTAPYYHHASQSIALNPKLRTGISVQHGKNQNYYLQKWGAEHPSAMDGNGNVTPFGDATKNWTMW